MKKLLVICLSSLMLMMLCCGCTAESQDSDPVTVTVAVDLTLFDDIKQIERAAEILYPELKIELICIDHNQEDMSKRDIQLESIKADIMAGKGPDAFVLSTTVPTRRYNDQNDLVEFDSLINYPEQSMRNQVFLPLDEYIYGSQNFSMNDHVSVIMDAGKYDGKQYILPLTYTYQAYLYNITDLSGDVSFDTWDDMVNYEKKGLANGLSNISLLWFNSRFVSLADYSSSEIAFTKDELLAELDAVQNMYDSAEGSFANIDAFDSLSEEFLETFTIWYEQAVAVPVLNQEDGITAFVNHYAAINANSEHPDEAYKFIELFFRPEIQSNSGFYYEDGGEEKSAAVNCRPNGIAYSIEPGIATGKVLYEEYPILETLNSRINAVRFYTPIDRTLHDIIYDYTLSQDESVVDIGYTKMKMQVSE